MISGIVLAFLGLSAIAVFLWWIVYNPVKSVTLSLPGMDNRIESRLVSSEDIVIGDLFSFFHESSPVYGTRWPRFRGGDFDNINKERIELIDQFGPGGPEILWTLNLGEGHAAPAVYDGKVYLLDYNEQEKADELRCFSLQTGEELWRRGYHVHLKRNHGLSRTVPAVNEKIVVTIGPKCQVMCVDRITGDFLWGIDLVKDYGSEVPFWYTGQCPLIDQEEVILATGGNALIIGVDSKTGEIIWETPNPHQWKMSHSSIMPMTFNGRKMYVYCAIGGVCGVAAEDPGKGTILWETMDFNPSVVAPSPVILDKGRIFLTAGYGFGGTMIQLKKNTEGFTAEVVQKYKPSEGLASEQQTPVYYQGYLYAIQPKDAGSLRNEFVCFHPDDCKNVLMRSGKTERFGLGPYLVADGKFYIVDDDGELTIAKATPSFFKVLGRTKVIDGQDAWGPVAITGGYLLMRDSKQLVCLTIKKR